MTLLLGKAAEMVGGRAVGDPDFAISGVAPFEAAAGDQITFASGAKFLKRIGETGAGAVIAPADFEPPGGNFILAENPQAAFVKLAWHFHPPKVPGYFGQGAGISPSAHVGAEFQAGEDLRVGPFAVIGDRVRVGSRATIHPHAVIGDGVRLGDDVEIHPHVVIHDGCRIGSRVAIQAGSVIGADGYGYIPDGRKYRKIPHRGIVRIDDDVEIGAGNTIDRGTFGVTRIGRGVKTDNLVHVAHNVTVGADTLLVAQVGIAGSTAIGSHAILAGQVGVAGHLKIGDDVTVGPQSGIGRDIPDGSVVTGSPEMDHRVWLRVQRILPMLPELKKRLQAVEKRLKGAPSDA